MNKNKKLLISIIVSIFIIIATILIIVLNNNNTEDKKSKYFINAISYIQKEEYKNAYNEVKKSKNKDELEIIQTIALYKFNDEIDKHIELSKEINDEVDHIRDYLTYTYIYSRDESYQQKIDKIYDEEYPKLYSVKERIPIEIMFEDSKGLYNSYIEYLDASNGIFKNYEYNIQNNQQGMQEKMDKFTTASQNLQKEMSSMSEKHPKSTIPEEYIILLDMSE